MSNRDLLRLAPQSLINSALRIDAEVISSDTDSFIKDNTIVYDLAINTWLLCIKEFAPYSWVAVATSIRTRGLSGTVSLFKGAAEALIKDEDMEALPKSVYEEITRRFGLSINVLAAEYRSTYSPSGIFLFLCRYLKRLTPQHADKLRDEAISSFKANQRRLKMLARQGYSSFILDLCRTEVDPSLIEHRISVWSDILMSDIEITPGVCYSKQTGRKLRTLADKQSDLCKHYKWDTLAVQRSKVWGYELGNDAYLTTVPKTLSQARTIAPEECLRQAIAHRMFTLSVNSYPGIDIRDQTINQHLAELGSREDSWATIDLSHASDDVTWVLVQEIYRDFPDYLSYLARIRPTYVNIDRARVLLQSFATMGNSYTFINESEIFWIISRAAVHFAQRHGVLCDDSVTVYGDDIIVAKEAFPYVTAFLSKLGFQVNEEKSFAQGGFRESCGKDYLNGDDVSSPYFPRKPLGDLTGWFRSQDGTLHTEAESLISLQHRLMDISPIAAQYIELFLRERKPDLGSERVGTQSTDLWSYDVVIAATRYIPEWVWTTVHPGQRVWKLSNGTWHYVEERRLKRVAVQDDTHQVSYQFRPTVSIETGPHNDDLVYIEYLSQGPYYQTDLDRLLGVSTSRYLIPTGAPLSEWRRMER